MRLPGAGWIRLIPDRDIPRYVDMILKGNINLEKLMTGYRLDEINRALDDLEAGRVIRPIIAFGDHS